MFMRNTQGAVTLELGRRCYAARALGEALALAQAGAALTPHAASALALLGDVHAALRMPQADADTAAYKAQWHATRCHVNATSATSASAAEVDGGPDGDTAHHRAAAAAAYTAALEAVRHAQASVAPHSPRGSSAPGIGGDEAAAADTRLRHATGWEATGCTAEGVRTLRRRHASVLNEAGQMAVRCAAQRGPDAAAALAAAEASFRQAADAFAAASDAANAALVSRNLAHAMRQRYAFGCGFVLRLSTLLLLPLARLRS
jgi:hypothetical protein